MPNTIGEMRIGDKLIFGKYGVSIEDPSPVVWLKASQNCDFITESVIDYLCFDAREYEVSSFSYFGNPNYKLSNIFSFLNSDAEDWYYKTHENDRPPLARHVLGCSCGGYSQHAGFLHYFEEYEIASLESITYDMNGDSITDRVRLPSRHNILVSDHEELLFDVFKKKGVRPHPSESLVISKGERINLKSTRAYAPFWTRDARSVSDLDIINRSGVTGRAYASYANGVRPVCTIKPDIKVMVLDLGGKTYEIKPFDVGVQDMFTDDELISLLGIA